MYRNNVTLASSKETKVEEPAECRPLSPFVFL
jgi:hypothetical protein